MSKTFDRSSSLFFFIAVAFIAVASRWLPHPPNFTAVSGFLFVGGVLANRRSKWFLLAALVPLALSDMLLGGYPGIEWVYFGHLMVLVLGFAFAGVADRGSADGIAGGRTADVGSEASPAPLSRSILPFAIYNLAAAFMFFVLSNVGVWWAGGLYPRTGAGLAECFIMALPFFHQTVIAQIIFSALFVYGYFWLAAREQVAATERV